MCCNGFRIVLMFTLAVLSFSLNAYAPSIPVIIWYLLAVNSFTFLLFGVDKYYALKDRERVSEITFYFFSIAGGVLGIILGIVLFRHKNHKKPFFIIVTIIALLWIFLSWYVLNNLENIQISLRHLID